MFKEKLTAGEISQLVFMIALLLGFGKVLIMDKASLWDVAVLFVVGVLYLKVTLSLLVDKIVNIGEKINKKLYWGKN